MHRRHVPSAELRSQALAQSDLLTSTQAGDLGLAKDARGRLVEDGHWQRARAGLYDTAPGHDSLTKRIWAAALATGEPCAIGGEAALQLHGLTRVVGPIVVWVPDDRRPRSHRGVAIRRDKIGRVDKAIGSPPLITVEDALIDVGQYLSTNGLVQILADAVRLRLTTVPPSASRRRTKTTSAGDATGSTRSLTTCAEWKARWSSPSAAMSNVPTDYRTDAVRCLSPMAPDLTCCTTRPNFSSNSTKRVGHEDASSAFRDLRRDNVHAAIGYPTLRYGSADVRGRPCEVARQVWEALSHRGWPEPFSPCPRCS